MAKAALDGLLKLKKQSDVEERRGVKLNLFKSRKAKNRGVSDDSDKDESTN